MQRNRHGRPAVVVLSGLGILAGVALSSRAPPGQEPPAPVPPERITDLSTIRLAPPTTPGDAEEAARIRVTRYVIENGAIAVTFDPTTGVTSILFPQGAVPPSLETDLPVAVATATVPTAAYDAAVEALSARGWSPEAARYAYGVSLDASTGLVRVTTDAPPEVTAAIAARHPGILVFERGVGRRL